MKKFRQLFKNCTEFIAATMLVAMFLTFLVQIFSRYVLQAPFSWTLEFCLILWVWIVFFGCAFIVREKDHVKFDILYNSAPFRLRKVLALTAAGSIVIGMVWAFLPTWDYIDFMKIRKTTTVRIPVTNDKIPMRTIFSVYAVFMVAVTIRYAWRFISVLRNGPPPDTNDQLRLDPAAIQDRDRAG